jgi:hypothetical protein
MYIAIFLLKFFNLFLCNLFFLHSSYFFDFIFNYNDAKGTDVAKGNVPNASMFFIFKTDLLSQTLLALVLINSIVLLLNTFYL